MIKLLCIIGVMDAGGAETFLMKNYRMLDRRKYQMDFITLINKQGYYDSEIADMGGKIYHLPDFKRSPIRCMYYMYRVVKDNEYNNVMLSTELSIHSLLLLMAYFAGAKNKVFRCTNTQTARKSWWKNCIHKMCLWLAREIPDVKIAPSTEAAEFMFGRDCVNNRKASILFNGLDLDIFCFDKDKRVEKRMELHLEDCIVVGHVGRLSEQKNHKKILDVFKKMYELDKNAVLILIGAGELKDDIRTYAKKINVFSQIRILGSRSDVAELLMSMDLLLFPSFYEGMPNVVIEAQVAGLPCLVSDTITQECQLTNLVKFNSLSLSDCDWAKDGLDMIKHRDREKYAQILRERGYDISSVNERFKEIMFR